MVVSDVRSWVLLAIELVLARWAMAALHEAVHLLAAALVGFPRAALTASNLRSALFSREVAIKGLPSRRAALVRHAGWAASCALAVYVAATGGGRTVWQLAVYVTALDALSSDLAGAGIASSDAGWRFCCGNFGILLLDPEFREKAISILRTMVRPRTCLPSSSVRAPQSTVLRRERVSRQVRVTMMRGAQSGGVVTYAPLEDKGAVGVRTRVVNGKRTNLSELLTEKLAKEARAARKYGELAGPVFYAGHTRFATSSKVTLDGTHPHQWTAPALHRIWTKVPGRQWESSMQNVEVFICHNGDLDSFEVGGKDFALDDVMAWIERATSTLRPSSVDSAGVAGLVDLLRAKGSWLHAVRFGYLFGPRRATLSYAMPDAAARLIFFSAAWLSRN